MRKIKLIIPAFCMAALLAGCLSDSATIVSEFDADGHIVRRTETTESPMKSLTDSTKNKTVIVWRSGWTAGISVATYTAEDPSPHLKIWAGKADEGIISAQKDQVWLDLAAVILATKQDITVTAEGITSTSQQPAK